MNRQCGGLLSGPFNWEDYQAQGLEFFVSLLYFFLICRSSLLHSRFKPLAHLQVLVTKIQQIERHNKDTTLIEHLNWVSDSNNALNQHQSPTQPFHSSLCQIFASTSHIHKTAFISSRPEIDHQKSQPTPYHSDGRIRARKHERQELVALPEDEAMEDRAVGDERDAHGDV